MPCYRSQKCILELRAQLSAEASRLELPQLLLAHRCPRPLPQVSPSPPADVPVPIPSCRHWAVNLGHATARARPSRASVSTTAALPENRLMAINHLPGRAHYPWAAINTGELIYYWHCYSRVQPQRLAEVLL